MLYHLLYPLHTTFSVFNVFRYITFRTIYASLTAFFYNVGSGLFCFFRDLAEVIAADKNYQECDKAAKYLGEEFWGHRALPCVGRAFKNALLKKTEKNRQLGPGRPD